MVGAVPPDAIRTLQLAATGLTTVEVAGRLGLPIEVVRDQLTEAIAALGARSKLEAVIIALGRGLIQPPNDQHDCPGGGTRVTAPAGPPVPPGAPP